MALSFRFNVTLFALSAMLLAVVFCGAASAQRAAPGEKKGLTFSIGSGGSSQDDRKDQTIGAAYCGKSEQGDAQCDPFTGDMSCAATLPILCILDIDAVVPAHMADENFWTGGVLSKSPPHSGASISTLAQANQICVNSFGQDWRVVSFHDGGGWAVKGYGNLNDSHNDPLLQRVWIDIKNQPDATCWRR